MKLLLLLLTATIAVATSLPGSKIIAFRDSIDITSMKLLKEIYEQAADKNVVSSPLGVLTLLLLYASGSQGESREEIMRLLDSTDYGQLSDSFSQLTEKFASIDPSFFIFANKVLISDKYSLDEGFFNTVKAYKSEVDKVNFEDQKHVADTINQWASTKTKGLITHPFSDSDIDANAVVTLLNAIWFQGHWHVPFNRSETKEGKFYVKGGSNFQTVMKPMMHLERKFYYYEDDYLGAKMIELPYKESKFRMTVVLPNEVDGLPQVLEKVSKKGLLESIFNMDSGAKVHLDMPKFDIRTKIDLQDVLEKVGVSSIFTNGSLGIVKGQSVTVSKIFQEAFIKVDEEGATAGAFTGSGSRSYSRPRPPIPFKVDRPFLYAILHNDIVLFAGTYTH